MHDKICLGEQRREVLGIAERGTNCASGKGLSGANHALDGVRIVNRHVRTRCGGECGGRLPGTPATKDQDVAPTQAPRRNGWRLKIVQGEAAVAHPCARVAKKVTMPRMPPIAPMIQKRKVICVSAQPSRSKWW